MKNALLFGATGFVGSFLLQDLLDSADYGKVTVVVRRPLEVRHPKLEVLIGDFKSLPDLKDRLVADDVFIAMGTTTKATPDRDLYYQIDHDYPVLAARLAKANGATGLYVVTAVGANANSPAFYLRLKGEIERDLLALDYQRTGIFRPSMIMGTRSEKRPLEKAFQRVWSATDFVFAGPLRRYRGIEGRRIALAMIRTAKEQRAKSAVFHWDEMI